MSQTEFNHLLNSLAALSPEQIQQLRHQLDSQQTAAAPPAKATAFDLLNRVGLIGCLESLSDSPTDLSTNKAHIQGFGRD